jgi:hypothetical protein
MVHTEIAETLGAPLGTVKAWVRRGLDELKACLEAQRLAALDKACFLPCAEYSDLKKAIAQYKANGGKASSSY